MHHIEVPDWARSAEGRKIMLAHSLDFDWSPRSRPLILMGGIHGDEPEGIELATQTLNWLKSNQARVPWVLIPCLNPDGAAKNQRTNGSGVDLNRNYPARSWSPDAREPRYNPGPHPASEPEIQAVTRLMESVHPRLVIHCHSWNPYIILTGEPARRDAEKLARATGYPLQDSIGYETPGSLSQYGWFDKQIPIICIEEQEGSPLPEVWPRFHQPISEIFLDPSSRGGES